jgi:D-3-phosphoglycerate dehydrogenase
MKKKVLIPTKLDAVARDILTGHGGYTVVQDDRTPIAKLAAAHPDTYALIVRSEKVDAALMEALPALKVVIRAGAGVNTIDLKEARRRGIDVMNTPGANANAVAEEVVALMLADARHLVKADPSCRAGEWEKKAFMGREIAGKTLGIVGLGAIGRLVARRVSGFDMRVLGYDPFIASDFAEELGVEMTDLPTLFSESDYVTLHVPENEQTRGMVNADLLSRMKPGATLVNCARAGIVVEADLRRIKADRGLRFLNDVYPKDEPGPKSVADLADLMVPHLGASTFEANYNAARRAAEQLIEFDDRGNTSYIVNRDIPEGLDPAYADLAYVLTRLARGMVGEDRPLKMVETSFYGVLRPFAQWLIVPIVAALNEDFDRSSDAAAARRFLRDSGVEYVDRDIAERRGYPNSMTIDLTASHGGGALRKTSVRGTLAEGRPMVARIDDFDRLYFEPQGRCLFFMYRDRPGVLGTIGAALAEAGINIDDVRNPHDSRGVNSLAIMKVNQAVPAEVFRAIGEKIEAISAFQIELSLPKRRA